MKTIVKHVKRFRRGFLRTIDCGSTVDVGTDEPVTHGNHPTTNAPPIELRSSSHPQITQRIDTELTPDEAAQGMSIYNNNQNTTIVYGSGTVYTHNPITTVINSIVLEDTIPAKIAKALISRYVPQAVYNAQPSSGCMDGTRVDVFRIIETWIDSPDEPPVFWLEGMTGMGKTAISWTICSHVSAETRYLFGGSFFCSRWASSIGQRDVRCIIPTLAQLLALKSPIFSKSLADELERDPGILDKQVGVQIEHLLYKPLLALTDSSLPILFVIDGLDECRSLSSTDGSAEDDEAHRIVSEMLEALVAFSRFSVKLPVKFFVTSRPETYIRDTLVSNSAFGTALRLHTIYKEQVTADIRLYVNTRLSSSPRLRECFATDRVDLLSEFCDGVFIIAATALNYILGAGIDAAGTRFKTLIKSTQNGLGTHAAVSLDRMCTLILSDATDSEKAETDNLSAMLQVLASLLSTRMTLSVAALADLLSRPRYHLRAHLSRLHAVVHIPENDSEPGLRILHVSFGDYLFDRAPSNIRLAKSLGHNILARACLERMAWEDLCFNVSHTRSSYQRNSLTSSDSIALSLVYASLHWAHHIAAAESGLDSLVENIFRHKFLFWLEVLIELGMAGVASGLLRIAASVLSSSLSVQFLRDASSFVVSSYDAIERNAPHIYLSALPFVSRDSLIYQTFSPLCTGLASVKTFGISCHTGGLAMSLTGHVDQVLSFAYSPDGHRLVSGSKDGTLRMWDTRTGEEVITPLQSSNRVVNSVTFSPNGRSIASASGDNVYIWPDLACRSTTLHLNGHSGGVLSVAFSSDGSILASGSRDMTIRLWETENGENIAVLKGHVAPVRAVVFSTDSQILASCSFDGAIQLWNTHTGDAIALPLVGEARAVFSIDFSPDGKTLATGNAGNIVIWEYQTWISVATLRGHRYSVSCIKFSPDAQLLVSSDEKSVRVWTLVQTTDVASSTVIFSHSTDVNSVAFSPDGQYIAFARKDSTIRIQDARKSQKVVQQLPAHSGAVRSVAVTMDGSLIVSGSHDRSIRMWDVHTGEPKLPPLLGHTDKVLSVTISFDGRLIASASIDRTIRLWDIHTGRAVGEPLENHEGVVSTVAFSPDGPTLASGSWDQTVRIWNRMTGTYSSLDPLVCGDRVNVVTFSHDGLLLAAGSSDGRIHLWQATTCNPVCEPLQADNYVESVAFSPTGAHIVSAGYGTVRVWEVTTSQHVLALDGHDSSVCSVAFSPDGRIICTGSSDHAIYLWDAATGALAATLYGHGRTVQSAVFTPDGRFIVSSADDGTIRVWDVEAVFSPSSDAKGNLIATLTSTRLQEGWLLGPSDELLLWVPKEYRTYLLALPCTALMGNRRIVVTEGEDGLHHGENWTKCWRDGH